MAARCRALAEWRLVGIAQGAGMAARKPRRKHLVRASLTVHSLSKAGTSLTLQIFADDEKLGELEIGRGAVYWSGRNRKTAKRLDWTRLAAYLDKLAYGE
jgi:hypothetical protein